jgi:manganese transport protein
MIPTIIVAAWVTDATQPLVISQIILSFVLPIPLITLVLFASSRMIMGRFANSRLISALAISGTVIVLFLNALPLVKQFLPL